MKYPYIQFYVGDWLKDPKLSLCSPATRGIWIDLVCYLHEMQNGGKLSANIQQFSRLCRCSETEMEMALAELRNTGTARVYEQNGIFTITCFRMERAADLSSKRQESGSKGGAKASAKREQNPGTEDEDGILRVREFAREEGISEADADWFFWKGKGNGWTNGGKPIKDWKATLRSWNRAGYLPSQKQSQRAAYSSKPMSAFEIEKRKQAISEEINKIFKSNGSKRVEGDGIDDLKKRRDELQQSLVA